MSKFKLYYGGQLFKMAGLVVKEMPPEKDVLTYTYEDGIYTMSISNPSRTTLRLLEQGNLVIAASVRDLGGPRGFVGEREYIGDDGEVLGYEGVRYAYHPNYMVPGGYGVICNRSFIGDITNFTFDESNIDPPINMRRLFSLSMLDGHDPIDSITTDYKFVLMNYSTGRVYKSYSKTDGYHPFTFYND